MRDKADRSLRIRKKEIPGAIVRPDSLNERRREVEHQQFTRVMRKNAGAISLTDGLSPPFDLISDLILVSGVRCLHRNLLAGIDLEG
jgi:hypothetical protein